MKARRVWRCLNLTSGGSSMMWTYESAKTFMQDVTFLGATDWERPIDPYMLQTAMQVEVLGWTLQTPWQTLLTVTDST